MELFNTSILSRLRVIARQQAWSWLLAAHKIAYVVLWNDVRFDFEHYTKHRQDVISNLRCQR